MFCSLLLLSSLKNIVVTGLEFNVVEETTSELILLWVFFFSPYSFIHSIQTSFHLWLKHCCEIILAFD